MAAKLVRFPAIVVLALGIANIMRLQAAEPTPPAVDSLGDPLPSGAVLRFGTQRLQHGGAVNTVAWSPECRPSDDGSRAQFVHDAIGSCRQ